MIHEGETNELIIATGSYLKVRENYSSRFPQRSSWQFPKSRVLDNFPHIFTEAVYKLRTILQPLQPALIHSSWQFASRKLHSPQAIYFLLTQIVSHSRYVFCIFSPFLLLSLYPVALKSRLCFQRSLSIFHSKRLSRHRKRAFFRIILLLALRILHATPFSDLNLS